MLRRAFEGFPCPFGKVFAANPPFVAWGIVAKAELIAIEENG